MTGLWQCLWSYDSMVLYKCDCCYDFDYYYYKLVTIVCKLGHRMKLTLAVLNMNLATRVGIMSYRCSLIIFVLLWDLRYFMVCNFLAEKQITYLFPMTVFVMFCLSFCPLIYTVNIWVSSFIVMLIVFGASLKKNEMLCQHCTVKLNFMCFKQVWIVISLNEEETFGVDCSCAVWHISLVPVVIVSTYCIHISKYTVGLFVDNRYIIQQWHHISSYFLISNIMWSVRLSFGTLTLLVGLQEGHLACKKSLVNRAERYVSWGGTFCMIVAAWESNNISSRL